MPDTVQKTLAKALQQLRTQRSLIDEQIAALRVVIDTGRSARRRSTRRVVQTPRRRKMSVAQRQAVSRRMKAYWAKRRAK
jgi:hypothetical protein